MATRTADVAVVGAGILGLAHAYALARRGRKVVVFERSPQAAGASVRNFGMIWPIGQPAGRMHAMALRSRDLWVEVLDAARLPYFPTGSLHLVYRADEAAVACEFCEVAPVHGHDSLFNLFAFLSRATWTGVPAIRLAALELVQNCLAFPAVRSDPCHDRAARGTEG
jgi:glycine/D-amino acid oxidase-like deaminating enzyme